MYQNEKFWNRIASNFDRIEQGDVSYTIFIEKIRRYFKGNERILDFGSGTGLICNEISRNVGFIYAIDISAKMMEISRGKAAENKIRNIEFAQTTLFDAKIDKGSLDAVIAFNIFHLLDEPPTYIQRLNELLKPGGMILSVTPCMSEAPFLNQVLKFSSKLGLTPELNAFTSRKLEQFFIGSSFEILELNRIKPNSPQYLCISAKCYE